MPKFLDLDCPACGEQVRDLFVMQVPERVIHLPCDTEMEHVYLPRQRERTQWSDKDAVVVYRKPDGSIVYPGRNDSPTPAGMERVVMRDLRSVERFEREHGVRSEMAWFDRGSGRGFDN
jgi:hypothetical protein